jgi:hypothetical protein
MQVDSSAEANALDKCPPANKIVIDAIATTNFPLLLLSITPPSFHPKKAKHPPKGQLGYVQLISALCPSSPFMDSGCRLVPFVYNVLKSNTIWITTQGRGKI